MVILYTTHCPRCNVLEKKLAQKGIEFETKTDFDKEEMVRKGFASAPLLEVEGKIMAFSEANEWINNN